MFDNNQNENINNPDLDINELLNGFQKLLVGLFLAKFGVSASQLFGSIAFVLFANDVSGVGVLDDGIAAAALAGTGVSIKIALDGALLAGAGAAETLGSAKKITRGLSNNKQASAASPSPLPPNQNDNDKDYYESNPKHNKNAKGKASREPLNAKEMFDESVQDPNKSNIRWYRDKTEIFTDSKGVIINIIGMVQQIQEHDLKMYLLNLDEIYPMENYK